MIAKKLRSKEFKRGCMKFFNAEFWKMAGEEKEKKTKVGLRALAAKAGKR